MSMTKIVGSASDNKSEADMQYEKLKTKLVPIPKAHETWVLVNKYLQV